MSPLEADLAIPLNDLDQNDTEKVGGKSANLGELENLGVPVLPGLTTTSAAYDRFLKEAGIEDEIRKILEKEGEEVSHLQEKGEKIRELIRNAELPENLKEKIRERYEKLAEVSGVEEPRVAVRSSATAEDLPDASFAGQQDTYLNVSGFENVLEAVKKCYTSLFTDRAISYREDKDFSHLDVKLSCVVQKMADAEASGVMFTCDPDSGFEGVVTIEASYGLGEFIVSGEVNPDTYTVFKKTEGIIEKEIGEKSKQMRYRDGENRVEGVLDDKRGKTAISDSKIRKLTRYAKEIEEHYGQPMDIEWVYDEKLDRIYILQARPETVHSSEDKNTIRNYSLEEEGEILLEGVGIGDRIGSGEVKKLDSLDEMGNFSEGDVLVTERTDPDWEPIMKKASAIVTDRGGKTSHAAIVSREMGVPAVIGAGEATEKLDEGQGVTVDCVNGGKILEGELEYSVSERKIDEIPETETDVMLILGNPSKAFNFADLPVDGVGLAREEFIISSHVGDHPLELIERGEEEKFVEALRSGIGKIAAAFHPGEVIVRLSDFKSDEYRNLEGGEKFESEESNPMLGFRGASRYYDEKFSRAFELECQAIKQVKDEIGLENVVVMVPFCRTPEEAEQVKSILQDNGLQDTDCYVMAEVPSNVLLADEFGEMFDGFSIGTNDLTQLTLGVDRNAEKLDYLFQEDHKAVKRGVKHLIEQAEATDSKIGICGDAPSTVEGYAEFLVQEGIDSISVSPDVALETILKVAEAEEDLEAAKPGQEVSRWLSLR
ncbi:MAG: phosphoenolpyruvate synthase [Candidatus Nanosalina sp.]